MTRISKRPLRKELEVRMFEIFWQCFADLKSPKEVFEFFEAFVSPAEKVMLAKRLAIAVLLEKGWDYQLISSTVKVSTSTVNSVRSQMQYRGDGYRKAARKVIANEQIADFLEGLAVDVASVISPVGHIGIAPAARKVAKSYHFQQRRRRDIL